MIRLLAVFSLGISACTVHDPSEISEAWRCKHKLYEKEIVLDYGLEDTESTLCIGCASYVDFTDQLSGERLRITSAEAHNWDCKPTKKNGEQYD
jgi:polyferredoxin